MRDVADGAPRLALGEALRRAMRDLRQAGVDGAGDDARRLLAASLTLSPAQLLARPERLLRAEEADAFFGRIARRAAREPVSRILGAREFYGRTFAISPATIDPRPESETLIEAALGLVSEAGSTARPLRVLDVGTGSGCLLLTLLAELPYATGVGTDVSVAALAVARTNAERCGLAGRSQWLEADMLEAVDGPFDILISNPPYIATGDIAGLAPEVRCHDPWQALDGGEDGLHFFRRLAARMQRAVPNGWVVLEVGHDQADAAAALLGVHGSTEVRFYRDVAGKRRCVAARTRN